MISGCIHTGKICYHQKGEQELRCEKCDGEITNLRNGESYAYNGRNELAAGVYPNATYAYAYDGIGDQKSAKPKPKARGDRDFKATPQEWSEERYSATQRQLYVVMYISESGAVSAEYTYDPFGKVTSHTGMDFDFQFSTKFYDPDIGMYYYGYRYYHPALMRWLTTDPLEEDGGLNLYEFCGNNANCYVDFNGLWSHPLWPDKPEVSVTQIPAIMRANGMSVSAKLMERWLTTASSSAMGEDISTVKMDWALSFTRAKTAYDEIFTSQLYATERCKNVIRAKIKALKPAKNIRFCDLSRDVRAVYKDQVTYKVVGSSYRDPIDDMLGALGRFTFQVALSANVKVKPYGYCAIVDEVGVFIRDQYEFSGIQPLGYWNPQTNYVGKNPYRGSLIENGTFQIYRNNTGLGGDFYIYSDVKRTKLEKPIKIRISK